MKADEVIEKGDVVVTDNRVVSVGPTGRVDRPAGAKIVRADGMTVMDCGSTNGTSVDEAQLAPNQPFALKGGETLKTGHFSFLYHTADGFVGYLKSVVKSGP